jgi:L-glyceraldehyde 3-phosphate reductase
MGALDCSEHIRSKEMDVVPRYVAASGRYDGMEYRRVGRSGLRLPLISLGTWYSFGDDRPFRLQRDILRRAFDLGITHFDLANNYGPPFGSAEENVGRLLKADFMPYRDELIISTKAGYIMWPGPYGEWGSRKYLLASLDQSLRRMGIDYVDIFYSHRFDPNTPLEETIGALHSAVRQGKALYAGVSSYSTEATAEAIRIMKAMGGSLLIHQPSYSMLNRWIEKSLLSYLEDEGIGCIAYAPLAQGLLTTKYLQGIPVGSRAARKEMLTEDMLNSENLGRVRALAEIAGRRGQTLPQMALAWALRDPKVTSVVVGVSSVAQLEENLGAMKQLAFSREELGEIDKYAVEGEVNAWAESSRGVPAGT